MHVSGIAAQAASILLGTSAVLASISSLQYQNDEFLPKIAGGEVASDDSYDFVAYIQAYNSSTGGTTCTGSLIAPNIVLTAAHCTFSSANTLYKPSEYTVSFNHTRPTTTSFKGFSVSDVKVNPDFNRQTLRNDLALLFLAENVPTTEAQSIKIFMENVTTDTQLFAAGFGITNPTDPASVPTDLMKVQLTAGSDSFCKQNTAGFDPNFLICTDGTAGKDTCQGDSGGPLVSPVDGAMALAGVTSFAPITENNPDGRCAQAGSTGFYVHIRAYIPWIVQATGLDENSIIADDASSSSDSSSSESSSNFSSVAQDSSSNADGWDGSDIESTNDDISYYSTAPIFDIPSEESSIESSESELGELIEDNSSTSESTSSSDIIISESHSSWESSESAEITHEDNDSSLIDIDIESSSLSEPESSDYDDAIDQEHLSEDGSSNSAFTSPTLLISLSLIACVHFIF
ncbi:hypothetical protein IWW36_000585 [Coemansia brasiliensis]|uniref:Peptidase S1 domain-containing protein n=1 Tax=Coemansia brasiliensis TaxID=2650707 RepID=A0A9W8M149_9FUNG|nr:hypothetical protein IWW36_000585 [Coemansia brasiliensis]